MPRLAAPLAAATLLLTAACAARQTPMDALNARPAQAYRGHYTLGAGGSWFRPCGAAPADSAWWVTVVGGATDRVDDAKRAGQLTDGKPSYAHWRAVLTRGGEVGPKGATALIVREVLTLRPAAANDCAPS